MEVQLRRLGSSGRTKVLKPPQKKESKVWVAGRGASCEIYTRSKYASRHHFAITYRNRRFYIHDLQSANGTYLNDERLTGEKPLPFGSTISVGIPSRMQNTPDCIVYVFEPSPNALELCPTSSGDEGDISTTPRRSDVSRVEGGMNSTLGSTSSENGDDLQTVTGRGTTPTTSRVPMAKKGEGQSASKRKNYVPLRKETSDREGYFRSMSKAKKPSFSTQEIPSRVDPSPSLPRGTTSSHEDSSVLALTAKTASSVRESVDEVEIDSFENEDLRTTGGDGNLNRVVLVDLEPERGPTFSKLWRVRLHEMEMAAEPLLSTYSRPEELIEISDSEDEWVHYESYKTSADGHEDDDLVVLEDLMRQKNSHPLEEPTRGLMRETGWVEVRDKVADEPMTSGLTPEKRKQQNLRSEVNGSKETRGASTSVTPSSWSLSPEPSTSWARPPSPLPSTSTARSPTLARLPSPPTSRRSNSPSPSSPSPVSTSTLSRSLSSSKSSASPPAAPSAAVLPVLEYQLKPKRECGLKPQEEQGLKPKRGQKRKLQQEPREGPTLSPKPKPKPKFEFSPESECKRFLRSRPKQRRKFEPEFKPEPVPEHTPKPKATAKQQRGERKPAPKKKPVEELQANKQSGSDVEMELEPDFGQKEEPPAPILEPEIKLQPQEEVVERGPTLPPAPTPIPNHEPETELETVQVQVPVPEPEVQRTSLPKTEFELEGEPDSDIDETKTDLAMTTVYEMGSESETESAPALELGPAPSLERGLGSQSEAEQLQAPRLEPQAVVRRAKRPALRPVTKSPAGSTTRRGLEVEVGRTEGEKKKVSFDLTPRIKYFATDQGNDRFLRIIDNICNWNTHWLEEHECSRSVVGDRDSPALCEERLVSIPERFPAHVDYMAAFLPAMFHQLWKKIKTKWVTSGSSGFRQTMSFDSCEDHQSETLSVWKFTGLVQNVKAHRLLIHEGHLVLLRLHQIQQGQSAIPASVKYSRKVGNLLFGFVESKKYERYSKQQPLHKSLAEKCSSTVGNLHLVRLRIIVKKSPNFIVDKEKLVQVTVLQQISPELRMFRGICFLPDSPLCSSVLRPETIQLPPLVPTEKPIIYQGPLDETQTNYVNSLSHSCFTSKSILQSVHGAAGAGKGQVILGLILQMLFGKEWKECRPRIIFCSQWSVPLDEMIVRLKDCRREMGNRFSVVRVGPVKEAKQEVLDLSLLTLASNLRKSGRKNLDPEFEIIKNADVICGTAISVGTSKICAAFRKLWRKEKNRKLICIMDDAMSCRETESVVPLLLGVTHLILFGDVHQLEPVHSQDRVHATGIDESLFYRIHKNFLNVPRKFWPFYFLKTQYRMNSHISQSVCPFIYGISLPQPTTKRPRRIKGMKNFLFIIDHTSTEIDRLEQESRGIRIAYQLIKTLSRLTKQIENDIRVGVITCDSKQLDSLQFLLPKREFPNVEMNLIQGSQGQEFDVVAFIHDGRETLTTWLAAALTRARCSLFVFGAEDSFAANPLLRQMAQNAEEQKLLRYVGTEITSEEFEEIISER